MLQVRDQLDSDQRTTLNHKDNSFGLMSVHLARLKSVNQLDTTITYIQKERLIDQ